MSIPQSTMTQSSQDMVYDLLMDEEDISWQTIIYDLVAQEKMDPWDVDISIIAVKFLHALKKLKETNFRISGKIVLASALLLRLKSQRLVDQDLAFLDKLMRAQEELPELFEESPVLPFSKDHPAMWARTPQPRKRKVSLYDLMGALEKALEVQHRRKRFFIAPAETNVRVPERKFDLTKAMESLFEKIERGLDEKSKTNEKLLFHHLTPSDSRSDKVLTFIPLLHLDTARKVDLMQEKHFGDIEVQRARLDPLFLAGIHESAWEKQKGSAEVKAQAAKTI